MSHTELFEHGRVSLQRLQYLVVAKHEQMFYNNHIANLGMCGRERVVTLDGREAVEYPAEMTNEEYRKRLIAIFAKMENTEKLRFWYKYISAIEKEDG